MFRVPLEEVVITAGETYRSEVYGARKEVRLAAYQCETDLFFFGRKMLNIVKLLNNAGLNTFVCGVFPGLSSGNQAPRSIFQSAVRSTC